MIFITGDTHIPLDLDKLMRDDFHNQQKLSENDFVIICGDFGGVWDNSKSRLLWLEKLNNRGFTTLFVDGNHENFELLNAFPIEEWQGGKIHRIKDNIIHLMRGQVYHIANKRIFTFGGANSIDKEWRTPYWSWWPQEMPSKEEYETALINLERVNYHVDFIITHTAPLSIIQYFYEPVDERPLNQFLEQVKNSVSYNKWIFGHVHSDKAFDEKHVALYDKILKLD